MKLPISWLKKYIDVSWAPEKLAEALTFSGTKVECVEKKSGAPVLEIEVTTNRPDCLSILGLAREVAVLTGKTIKFPRIKLSGLAEKDFSVKPPEIHIEDKKGCPKYTARLIKNIKIEPSSTEIKKCLESMDARPINNVVDATNFVLFEMGQPLHAFDYDKLAGGKIIVRRAKAGEKFLGIDDGEYTLDEKTLVIADAERPVAIAGVMGGKLTEVTDRTKNILLESAYFDSGLVRQASRKYKLSTESSYRFERGVNPNNILPASARARDLILESTGAVPAGPVVEKGDFKVVKIKPILLSLSRLDEIMGMKIPAARIIAILNHLEFHVKKAGQDHILVTPPSLRSDIYSREDIIEEILRIEGFDKVPAALPVTRHSETAIQDPQATGILELKKLLANLGFNEIISTSLISEKALVNSGFKELNRAQKITNLLSAEQEFFRPLLLPGMLQSILTNVHQKADSLKLFEIGNRYLEGKEETVLAISLYGNLEENWRRKNAASFYDLKGIIENMLAVFKIKDYQWKENEPCPKYENSSSLEINGKKYGTLGVLNPDILNRWDISHAVIYMELMLDGIFKKTSEQKTVRAKVLPKYPLVRRDIAFIIDEKISVQSLEDLMKNAAAPLLSEVQLFDEYTGKNIAADKRSLAFSLAYQKETGTFTEEEINALQAKVSGALKNTHRVEFR